MGGAWEGCDGHSNCRDLASLAAVPKQGPGSPGQRHHLLLSGFFFLAILSYIFYTSVFQIHLSFPDFYWVNCIKIFNYIYFPLALSCTNKISIFPPHKTSMIPYSWFLVGFQQTLLPSPAHWGSPDFSTGLQSSEERGDPSLFLSVSSSTKSQPLSVSLVKEDKSSQQSL